MPLAFESAALMSDYKAYVTQETFPIQIFSTKDLAKRI